MLELVVLEYWWGLTQPHFIYSCLRLVLRQSVPLLSKSKIFEHLSRGFNYSSPHWSELKSSTKIQEYYYFTIQYISCMILRIHLIFFDINFLVWYEKGKSRAPQAVWEEFFFFFVGLRKAPRETTGDDVWDKRQGWRGVLLTLPYIWTNLGQVSVPTFFHRSHWRGTV